MGKGLIWVIVIIIVAVGAYFIFSGGSGSAESLSLSFTNLEPLEKGHYEGWAIYGNEKVSTGKFNVGESLTFDVGRNLKDADKIVITIEPEGDVDNIPSGVVILAGDIESGNSVSLGFPIDLNSAKGTYILGTPTNGDGNDENSGIWFLKVPSPLSASLELPDSPDGWIYEGWAVNQGKPISTGKFKTVTGIDDFDGYSGEQGAPAFPGEDFLENAPAGLIFPVDLADGESKAVISVEPDINGEDPTGDGPFSVKPLVGDIPSGASDHVNLQMNSNLGSVPSGRAEIS
jgi:hypothetical protein